MTTESSNADNHGSKGQNPYIGPRAFAERDADRFFGRQREARDLRARVVSERLLLFYAQSGAGKSSLIHTRLIPGLRDQERFAVLPVGHVSGEVLADMDAVDNIYAFNLMASLDQSGEHPGRLAHLSLSEFLAHLVGETQVAADGQRTRRWIYRPDAAPPEPSSDLSTTAEHRFALIIDQFEEIISTYPEQWQHRAEFFKQINQAMQADPNLWVVLTLREDYVASLDPYSSLLEEKLQARFRMDRMGVAAALEAVKQPARQAGRPFAPDVAETLVRDLRQVRVAGQEATIAGQYVEPVQLQVVCYQLWERVSESRSGGLPAEDQITQDDLEAASDVNRSLEHFYADTLAAVIIDPDVAGAGVSERSLRAWFDKELITETGIRGTVYRNEAEGQTGSLPNVAVDALSRRFLVRTELRGGGAWVELVHDRFVEPIRASNAAWFEAHIHLLAVATQRWLAAERKPSHLLEGEALANANRYAQSNAIELTGDERIFLADSNRAEKQRADAERQRRRITVGAILVAVIMIVITTVAVYQTFEADEQRDHARQAAEEARAAEAEAKRLEAQAWAAVAEQQLQVDPVVALHVGLASLPTATHARPYVPAAELALSQALQRSAETESRQLSTEQLTARLAAIRPGDDNEMWIAAGSDALRTLQVTGRGMPDEPAMLGEPVLVESDSQDALVWDDGGRLLLRHIELLCDGKRPQAGGRVVCEMGSNETSRIELFQIQDGKADSGLGEAASINLESRSQCSEWQPAGTDIAICQEDEVRLWSPSEDNAETVTLATMDDTTQSVHWSIGGSWLVALDASGNIAMVEMASGNDYDMEFLGTPATVRAIQWAPTTSAPYLVAGTDDGRAVVWDSAQLTVTAVISGDLAGNPLGGLAFINADEFLTWGPVTPVRRWSRNGELLDTYRTWPADEQVQDVRLSPDNQQMLAFLSDGTARLWWLNADSNRSATLSGHTKPMLDAAWHPSGSYVATAAADGTARVWDLGRLWEADRFDGVIDQHATQIATLFGHGNLDTDPTTTDVLGVRWLDEQRLLTWGEDGTFRNWEVLQHPVAQTCNGAPTENGVQRLHCQQYVLDVRTPELLQWIDDNTLLAANVVAELVPETPAYIRHLQLNRLNIASGEVMTAVLDARQLPEVVGRGYQLPTTAGRGALMPVQQSGRERHDKIISLVDGSEGHAVIASLPSVTDTIGVVSVFDGSQLATVIGDLLTVWQVDGDEPSVRWSQTATSTIGTLAWSADGRHLLAAGDGVALWDADSGETLWSWQPNSEEGDFSVGIDFLPIQAALSEDSEWLAVAQGRHIGVISTDVLSGGRATELEWTRLHAHDDAIHGLTWIVDDDWMDPPGSRSLLLSWSGDGSARLWDWQRDAEIWRAQGAGSIEHATVSPGGTYIATTFEPNADYGSNAPGGLRLWRRWSPEELRAAASAAANRPLSEAQKAARESAAF